MKLLVFLGIFGIASLVNAAIPEEQEEEAAAIFPLVNPAPTRNRWIPINLPIPRPPAAATPGTSPGAATPAGTCPGGRPRGCPEGQCDATNPRMCTAGMEAFCYDRTLAYPIGCPGGDPAGTPTPVYCAQTC